ncbi:MAG: VWA domain-containing protein [Saprospiraceae bacterium]
MMQFLSNIHFASPWWFLGFLVIPYMIWWQYYAKKSVAATITISDLSSLKKVTTWKESISLASNITDFVYTIFHYSYGKTSIDLKEEKIKAEGLDIMMVMDLSSSMLSRDFDPDRLEVSKMVAKEFVAKRVHDRLGLVVFSGEAFTQCPLTMDHQIVTDFLSSLQVGMLADGTAIGMGLATAVNRLKDSKAKSKIIILLTDGVNNAGYIDPNTAADIAKEMGVKVYTIAVGTMGQALSPVNRRSDGQYMYAMAQVEIDTELLQKIAEMTDGKYFRAIDRQSLENIYTEIDRLEKTEIEIDIFKRYKDEYRIFLYLGLAMLLLWWLLKATLFRTIS